MLCERIWRSSALWLRRGGQGAAEDHCESGWSRSIDICVAARGSNYKINRRASRAKAAANAAKAVGRKVSDEFTVPLCRGHHRDVHRCGDEGTWWRNAGVDPLVLARKPSAAHGSGRTDVEQSIGTRTPIATANESLGLVFGSWKNTGVDCA